MHTHTLFGRAKDAVPDTLTLLFNDLRRRHAGIGKQCFMRQSADSIRPADSIRRSLRKV